MPVNTPRDSALTSPSVARVLAVTARNRSRNTTRKIPLQDKAPRIRPFLRPDEFCRPTKLNSSHPRRSATAWKPHPTLEAPKRFSSDPNFDLQHVRSSVRITSAEFACLQFGIGKIRKGRAGVTHATKYCRASL